MHAVKLLPVGLALLLSGCAGASTPASAPPTSTTSTTTPVVQVTIASPTLASASPVAAASVTPAVTVSVAPPSAPASLPGTTPAASTTAAPPAFDAYPTQYKFAFLNAIVNRDGTMAAVLDPVTMCTSASTDAACKAAIHGEEYLVLNQSTKTYTVPFTPGGKVKYLRSGMPNDYRTESPTVRSWAPADRQVYVVTSNGTTLSVVAEWWHP